MQIDKNLSKLVELAKGIETSANDREEQRRSFVYGNVAIEDQKVTREFVNERADKLVKKG